MQIKRLFPCVLSVSVALGMLSSSNAVALGLGDIEVHSSLNQPLNAEIKLFSLERGEFESLNVKLASPEMFAREDLDRLAILSKLNFELVRLNGVPHVRVLSHEPIIEPFLDFLIEVNWNRGRLIREYTLLLDPPDLTSEKPAPLSAPVTTHAMPAQSRVTTEPVANRQYGQVTHEGDSISYGATARNDTLWKIAREVRPDSSVSIFQVMMALLKANPEAFYHNNINSLKAGYILRLDDVALLTAISKKQASEEYKLQNQQWQAIKQGKAQVAGKSTQSIDSSQAVSESKVVSDASSIQPEKQARLELVVPDDGVLSKVSTSATELTAHVEKLQHDLGLALSGNETTEKENTLLLSRLAELETQVNELRRLLSIESETLSNLQNREVDSAVETAAHIKDYAPQTSATKTEQQAATPPVAQPDQQKEEVKPDSFVGGLLKDPTALGLVAAVGLGLLALGAIVMRRRSRDKESFEDDDYAEIVTTLPSSEDSKFSGGPAQFGTPANDGGDSYAEAEVTTEQAAVVEEDMQLDYEIDPLDEADVYIAYRRYPQAEDLLKEAIQIDPDRNKLHVKLLEIYAATDDQDAFIAQAELLKASLKEDEGYLWSEVSSMASEVCPGHVLFQNGEQVALLQESEVNQLSSFDADALDESSPLFSEEIDLTGDEKLFEEELVSEHLVQPAPVPAPLKEALETELESDSSIAFEGGLGAGLVPLIKNTEESTEKLTPTHADLEEDKNEALFEERIIGLTESLQSETGDLVAEITEEKIEALDDFSDLTLTDDDSADSDDDWLSKMDEVGTRLDLARAYVDMGDETGAREILEDVLEKGDDQQKKDALSLMQQLS